MKSYKRAPLVDFNDINGRKVKALIFCFIPNPARESSINLFVLETTIYFQNDYTKYEQLNN
jgi:hypothetical protein